MITVHTETLDGEMTLVRLSGSLDIEGTESVELRLTTLTSTGKALVILDLSAVSLLASIGIGLIMRCFKAARLHGGNIVILSPSSGVALVLERSNTNKVIPLAYDLQQAREILRAA